METFRSNYNTKGNIGTIHWFRTIIANAKHCAEFIEKTENNSELTKKLKKQYAVIIQDCFKDLLLAQRNGSISLTDSNKAKTNAQWKKNFNKTLNLGK